MAEFNERADRGERERLLGPPPHVLYGGLASSSWLAAEQHASHGAVTTAAAVGATVAALPLPRTITLPLLPFFLRKKNTQNKNEKILDFIHFIFWINFRMNNGCESSGRHRTIRI